MPCFRGTPAIRSRAVCLAQTALNFSASGQVTAISIVRSSLLRVRFDFKRIIV